jgi:hypothetical protein
MWWQQYRKTLIPTQVFILAICAVAYFAYNAATLNLLVLLGVTEVAAVLGAFWSLRLKRRIERAGDPSNKLPKLPD